MPNPLEGRRARGVCECGTIFRSECLRTFSVRLTRAQEDIAVIKSVPLRGVKLY